MTLFLQGPFFYATYVYIYRYFFFFFFSSEIIKPLSQKLNPKVKHRLVGTLQRFFFLSLFVFFVAIAAFPRAVHVSGGLGSAVGF